VIAHFLASVILFMLGMWLIRRSRKSAAKPLKLDKPAPPIVPPPDPRVGVLENALKTMRDSNELDKRVAEDAIAREARAKAALIAVLRGDGCTDEQIAVVLRQVENRKDGDL